jgi:nitrite reductase/ring-hydroxylating ferredoxin subunit
MPPDRHPSRPPAVPYLGSYRRHVPVGLERLQENLLDWQRLPHIHRDAVAAVTCHAAGAWGWRATLTTVDGERRLLDLQLERRSHGFVVRVLEGHGAGTEIWTTAHTRAGEWIDLEVDFFVPEVQPAERAALAQRYAACWERLWDADVAMMVERQRQIDRRIDAAPSRERERLLGRRDALRLPMNFELAGRHFILVEVAGELLAFPQRCPHQLGPLTGAGLDEGVVTCPWHGYRFDVRSGENLSGGICRLSHRPLVTVGADGSVRVRASHSAGFGGREDGCVREG